MAETIQVFRREISGIVIQYSTIDGSDGGYLGKFMGFGKPAQPFKSSSEAVMTIAQLERDPDWKDHTFRVVRL